MKRAIRLLSQADLPSKETNAGKTLHIPNITLCYLEGSLQLDFLLELLLKTSAISFLGIEK